MQTMTDATAEPFSGAKLILYLGDRIVVIRRDVKPGLPWPGYLDFPGGAREPGESPEACALRETQEEIGLIVDRTDLIWRTRRDGQSGLSWFFAARLPATHAADIVFGNEGQGWDLMLPAQYIAAPDAIPHFAEILARQLASGS